MFLVCCSLESTQDLLSALPIVDEAGFQFMHVIYVRVRVGILGSLSSLCYSHI